jgi:hypothetical protein
MCDAAGWEAWSYDSRGHVITERRSTNSIVKSTAYAYNFHGGVDLMEWTHSGLTGELSSVVVRGR